MSSKLTPSVGSSYRLSELGCSTPGMSMNQRKSDNSLKNDIISAKLVFVLVAGSLFLSWLAQEFLEIKHGEFLTALLILPAILFFVISRRISKFTFGGASAEFVDERLRETALQLQQEQERLAYIGKLEQALNKDGSSEKLVGKNIANLKE
ncbi:MAG: hypothetical protein ABFS45_22745 [Pseudomonadota bacterium]